MNNIIIKSFILRLGFISERTKFQNTNLLEINILNIDNNIEKIEGKTLIKNEINEIETIDFNIQLSKSDDMLIFRTNYKSDKSQINDDNVEIDTFVIINPETKSYIKPKTKYLIHLVDNQIKQAYIVNKKYKFENGINENYTKINMDNKEIVNDINSIYSSNKSRI